MASSAENSYHLAYRGGSGGTGGAGAVSQSEVDGVAGRVLAFDSLDRLISYDHCKDVQCILLGAGGICAYMGGP